MLKHLPSLTWVIESLRWHDNFIHGTSVYAVSIALIGKRRSGFWELVYEINKTWMFLCHWRAARAYLQWHSDQSKARQKPLSDSLIATWISYYNFWMIAISTWIGAQRKLMKSSHGLPYRLGEIASSGTLWLVAAGRSVRLLLNTISTAMMLAARRPLIVRGSLVEKWLIKEGEILFLADRLLLPMAWSNQEFYRNGKANPWADLLEAKIPNQKDFNIEIGDSQSEAARRRFCFEGHIWNSQLTKPVDMGAMPLS